MFIRKKIKVSKFEQEKKINSDHITRKRKVSGPISLEITSSDRVMESNSE